MLLEPHKLEASYKFHQEEVHREHMLALEQGEFTLKISQLFASWPSLDQAFANRPLKKLSAQNDPQEMLSAKAALSIRDNALLLASGDYDQLFQQIAKWHERQVPILLVAKLETNALRIQNHLAKFAIKTNIIKQLPPELSDKIFDQQKWFSQILILVAQLESGYRVVDDQGQVCQAIITDFDIYGQAQARKLKKKRRPKLQNFLSSIDSLQVGDYVVHADYGIGRYEGLSKIPHTNSASEFINLSYHGKDRLFVPVTNIDLLQKYSHSETAQPALHRLDDARWQGQKARVKKAVEKIAGELLELYAKRKAQVGISLRAEPQAYYQFCKKFPYQNYC